MSTLNGYQETGHEFKDEYEFMGYVKRALETIDKRMDKLDMYQEKFNASISAMKIKIAGMAGAVAVVTTALFSFLLHLLGT
jgi:hypothetical protein